MATMGRGGDAACVLIPASDRIPHRSATNDNKGQGGVDLLQERHHSGRCARCGHGKVAALFTNDVIERVYSTL